MRLPRVLTFTVIYDGKDYCAEEFFENAQKFTYKYNEHIIIDNSAGLDYYNKLKERYEPLGFKVYHTERGNTTREALTRSQNFARKLFLEGEYDYLFSLESDIFPKANILDVLVSHNLDVVGALYMLGFKHDHTRTPCIMLDHYKEATNTWGTRILQKQEFMDYMNKGVKEVAAGGMGATLMYREVVEKVAYTYIPGHRAHSDVFWCNDARKAGYLICVDTNVLCDHKNSDWTKVTDR